MPQLTFLVSATVSCLLLSMAVAQPDGLIAQWNLDEGHGSTFGNNVTGEKIGQIHGAAWVRQGNGFALAFDGLDDHIRFEHAEVSGPVSLEAWIKPTGVSHGEAHLVGNSMSSYAFTYLCHHQAVWWYIGNGSNHVRGLVDLGRWNHIVGTFDGTHIGLWINGRRVDYRKTKYETYQPAKAMGVGTPGRPELPDYKGAIDNIRMYNRALTDEQVIAHFKQEAVGYGFDPRWFERVKVTSYDYPDQETLVVEADYRRLHPLDGNGRIEVTLAAENRPEELLQQHMIDPVPESGLVEVTLDCTSLTEGRYLARLQLTDGQGARPVERIAFAYPPAPRPVPPPADKVVGALPLEPGPTPYEFTLDDRGGFVLKIKNKGYPFNTRISWPNGGFNHLVSGEQTVEEPEKSWQVSARSVTDNRYEVQGKGDHYTLHRKIDVRPTHVYVRDTYTNTTQEDLGLLIYNEMPIELNKLVESRLGGWERGGQYTGAFSPSVFVEDDHTGIGIIPIDDMYVIQSVLYSETNAAGAGTEKFALAPGASHTLEWAVYPTSSGEYFDFINAFRQAEDRIGTIDGVPGFISWGPMNRRQVPDEQFVDYQDLRYGIIHCLSAAADDPEVSIEGIEFMDFPKEMTLLRRQTAAIRKRHPTMKTVFHVAHSLYCTNDPDRFADSKVIHADGKQAMWGWSEAYISKQRKQEGWRWWIYYPTPGNSFHDALIRSADVMIDDLGMDGAFMDGFFAAYQGLWTYDGTWDGHSADIDLNTKTIKRKVGSVLLLSQPSLIEFCRRIRDKGGVIIANNSVITRSIANEKYIIHDWETDAGPQLHLAPNITALVGGNTETKIYRNTLETLSWGGLVVPYSIRIPLTRPLMVAKQFPMTFERIGAGLVRGKQRIVTMNNGIYGWEDNNELHLVHKYDSRGATTAHAYLTTADTDGVRTQLNFAEHESAVIEPIPVTLDTTSPVNMRVLAYDDTSLHLLMHGQGQVELSMFVGATYQRKKNAPSHRLPGSGANYRVTANGQADMIMDRDGIVTVPLTLDGQIEVEIYPEM